MNEETIKRLRNELIEHKTIASGDYNDPDPFVGIYFSDLIALINKCCNIQDNTEK